MADIPEGARRRIREDRVVWLTTVTDSGAPAPNPVWFVPDGDDIVIFTMPGSRKVHNIGQRPVVTLNFNSDPQGDDIVVIVGRAEITHDRPPSQFPGYLSKYEADIIGPLNTTVQDVDATYNTQLRVRVTRVRLLEG
jgi:PPOX class probable F420-dependent enzyme